MTFDIFFTKIFDSTSAEALRCLVEDDKARARLLQLGAAEAEHSSRGS